VSLFGSEVIDVLAKLQAEMGRKRRGEGSEILDTLIAYEWKQMFGGLDHDPSALDRQPIRIQQVERDGRAQE
jgi:hypothetical protein